MSNKKQKEVPHPELCKKLADLSYSEKSIWRWAKRRGRWEVFLDEGRGAEDYVEESIPAPSVVEMLSLLPLSITDENGMPYYLLISKGEDFWSIGYHLIGEYDYYLVKGKDKSLANAVAKVLIELIEKEYFTGVN